MSTRERTAAQRDRLAYEAARIILEQGLTDYDRARRKAAERVGTPDRRHWPTNEAVQAAVLAQRRLFLGREDVEERRRLRAAALQAMTCFAAFSPRLVGDALSGAVSAQTRIELLLFADRPEDVIFALIEQQIPWREAERVLRHRRGQRQGYPAFRFLAGDLPVELVVLPPRALRDLPLDPVTDRPFRGADRAEVEQLLCADQGEWVASDPQSGPPDRRWDAAALTASRSGGSRAASGRDRSDGVARSDCPDPTSSPSSETPNRPSGRRRT